MSISIREATPADGAALSAIYAHYVTDTEITFETVPPTAVEFSHRIEKTLERYPYYVCQDEDGRILGYAYASRHGERAAYEYTVDVSVYVDKDYRRHGVAAALYDTLLPELTRRGFRTAIAIISIPNAPSAAFHAAYGFMRAGTYHEVGWKHGRWIDQMLLERPLNGPLRPRRVQFTKMQGCGNDYIYIDRMDGAPLETELIPALSDRHFGVGGDGVVFICPSRVADARMAMYNIDGSEGMMCGNAVRCVGKYLRDTGRVKGSRVTVETRSGIKTLELGEGTGRSIQVTVDMGPARITAGDQGGRPVQVAGGEYSITRVSMGNPHCVLFCDKPEDMPLETLGPKFEHDPMFPEGVNTEFVKVIDRRTLRMRVWERGSGETLACGTGACACAVAAVAAGLCDAGVPILIHARGGELTILPTDETVYLTGDTVTVFEGAVTI